MNIEKLSEEYKKNKSRGFLRMSKNMFTNCAMAEYNKCKHEYIVHFKGYPELLDCVENVAYILSLINKYNTINEYVEKDKMLMLSYFVDCIQGLCFASNLLLKTEQNKIVKEKIIDIFYGTEEIKAHEYLKTEQILSVALANIQKDILEYLKKFRNICYYGNDLDICHQNFYDGQLYFHIIDALDLMKVLFLGKYEISIEDINIIFTIKYMNE